MDIKSIVTGLLNNDKSVQPFITDENIQAIRMSVRRLTNSEKTVWSDNGIYRIQSVRKRSKGGFKPGSHLFSVIVQHGPFNSLLEAQQYADNLNLKQYMIKTALNLEDYIL